MDPTMQEQVAAARYALIAPIVSRQTPLFPGELRAWLEETASRTYDFPGSVRKTVSIRTLGAVSGGLPQRRLGGAQTAGTPVERTNAPGPGHPREGQSAPAGTSGTQCGTNRVFTRREQTRTARNGGPEHAWPGIYVSRDSPAAI